MLDLNQRGCNIVICCLLSLLSILCIFALCYISHRHIGLLLLVRKNKADSGNKAKITGIQMADTRGNHG